MEQSIPYIIGTSAIVITILFGIIAYWFKDLLNKVGQITSIIKDIEYLKERFQELRVPIEKIGALDREIGVIRRDLTTAFSRVDEVRLDVQTIMVKILNSKERE